MKTLEERLQLLDEELSKHTPESLLLELKSLSPSLDIPEICHEVAHWDNNHKYQRRIVSAANRYQLLSGEFLVVPCVRHYSKEHHLILEHLPLVTNHVVDDNQGFIDQYSNYWTREEALIIASHAGQINTVKEKSFPKHLLFSEDLY